MTPPKHCAHCGYLFTLPKDAPPANVNAFKRRIYCTWRCRHKASHERLVERRREAARGD